jgi:hypothetical protein
VGRVGGLHYDAVPDTIRTFYDNVTVSGGPAPAGGYIEALVPVVLETRIHLGRVLDRVTVLDGVPAGHRAMHEREAITGLIAV